MDKQRLRITMKVLDPAKAQFPKTVEFTEEPQEQECLKENISVDEVIFLFTSLETKSQHKKTFFYFVVLGFKAEKFLLELHSAKYVK